MKYEHYPLGDEIIDIPIPESYKDCLMLIKSDRYRVIGDIESLYKVLLNVLMPFKNSFLFWFRLSQYKGLFYPVCRVMHEINVRRYQLQISPQTRIGYGFYIGHGTSVVINPGTIIGNNVNISHFLSIGTNHETPAIIGNNVYIGPHVSIVECVKVGSRTTIGANAVVVKDTPSDSTVVGNPARIVNYNKPGRYIVNPFLYKS